ncbi:MAG: hypothetical protein NTX53_18235 [candidate division WOR-3 bacterium]|nr:hypothetical protein [candidate division WOR-3 bacterium]
MYRRNVCPSPIVLAALAALCFVVLSGCHSTPAKIELDDLSVWIYVEPNPVGVGEQCTRYSSIYNRHETDTACVDSVTIDTLVFAMDFLVAPDDTVPTVEEMGLTYPSAGAYIHTLTYYTTIGTFVCPPCTVTVE